GRLLGGSSWRAAPGRNCAASSTAAVRIGTEASRGGCGAVGQPSLGSIRDVPPAAAATSPRNSQDRGTGPWPPRERRGLTPGAGISALVANGIAPQELCLAALQAGWYYTPINWHFTAPEIAYIVRDTESKAFFVHERFGQAGATAADDAGLPADARFSYGSVP